jgi:hypothetical protein
MERQESQGNNRGSNPREYFDTATTGTNAALWVGESWTLPTLAVVIVAVIVSLGHWTIIRIPAKRRGEPVRTAMSEEAM